MRKDLNYTLKREFWFVNDFETIHENTNYWKQNQDTRVILFHIKSWDNSINRNGVCIEEWWDFYKNLGASATLFFHNLKFDGDFILKYLVNVEKFKINNSEEKVNRSIKVFRNGGRIYFLKIFFKKRVGKTVKDINIVIRCSLQLLSSSIAALGKSVGIEKLSDEDKNNKDFYVVEPVEKIEDLPENFVKYCERDCEIMRLSLIALDEAISTLSVIQKYNSRKKHKEFNVFNSLTIAALSRRLMKYFSNEYIYKNDLDIVKPLLLSNEDYHIMERFYRGGWTQINPEYIGAPKWIGRGLMVDVVSAYPYQMTFDIPYGEVLYSPPKEKHYTFLEIKVKKAVIKKGFENCAILKNWKKDLLGSRYVLELKNFTCYYLEEEWEVINKFYDIETDEIMFYYMKKVPFLKEYAEEVIAKKTSYKKEGKKAFSQMMKILANSAYGCLAMRDKFDTQLYLTKKEMEDLEIEEDKELVFNDKNYKFKRTSDSFNVGDYCLNVWELLEDKESLPNKAAAAVITALQRCYLWNMILDIGVKHFGLSDTDSILFINLDTKAEAKLRSYTGDELGDWEIENFNYVNYFGTYGAKKYVLLDDDMKELKLKMSGISLDSLDLKENFNNKYDMDEPELIIENATLSVKYCKSGIMLLLQNKVFKKGTI